MTTGFLIAPGTSAEELAERRRMAYALSQAGMDTSPVGHWTQGLARALQGIRGGYELSRMREEDARERSQAQKLLGDVLNPAAAPQTSSTAPQYAPTPMQPAQGAAAAAGRPYEPNARPAQPAQASAAAAGRPYPTPSGTAVADFIKQQEGYTPQAAWDRRQYSSGYGTKAAPGEVINRDEAERRLQAEITPINAWINQNVTVPLNDQQRAGLTSFAYNLGVDDLQKLLPDINAGNWQRVAARMQSFNKALNNDTGQLEVVDGLTSRRQREAQLLTGGGGMPSPQTQTASVATTGQPTQAAPRGPLGIDPATAQVIQKLSGNRFTAPLASKLLEAALTPQNKVGRYRPSRQGIVDTVTGQIVPGTEQSGADNAEYGTSPQYYRDADGKLRIGQLSKAGGMRPVELPNGAEILPGIDYKDTGTAYVGFDKRTGQAVQSVPKDVAGEQTQREIGKDVGIARTALPSVESTTNRVLGLIDELETSPMRQSFTGYSGYLPNMSPEANDYQAKLNQVASNAFLQAFNSLRGGGAITEAEGQKATSSLTRLQQLAPSDQGFQQALEDTRNVMREILTNARKRAGMDAQAPSASPPTGGGSDSGYKVLKVH